MTTVRCDFCFHNCLLKEGQLGVCKVRQNQNGSLVSLNYGQVVAKAVDPIEKKPLYHFLPGSSTYSFALFGCNFECLFCQNHNISQNDSPYHPTRFKIATTQPKEIFQEFLSSKTPTVSYTYSDPIVWQDYMLDVASLVKESGRYNCMVTNGSFTQISLERALKYIDAFNIDVKGDESFYKKYCKGKLEPVLDAIETIAKEEDKVLEITSLLIEDIHSLKDVEFLADQLNQRGVKVWHISRFFPHYKMDDYKITSEEYLQQALKIGKGAVEYLYAGNSSLDQNTETRCPNCHSTVIKNHKVKNLAKGRCLKCNYKIYGKFD